jgi:integrase
VTVQNYIRFNDSGADCAKVTLGKGGRTRRIQVLHPDVLSDLCLSHRFVYLNAEQRQLWKDSLRRYMRLGCDALGILRRGVHGFRGTAACEFVENKEALGRTELEARRELAQWLGHNPHRTEVTYAYVPEKTGERGPSLQHQE